jgi:hypothetical protein
LQQSHIRDFLCSQSIRKKALLRKQPWFTISGFRSQQRSRHPVWVKQAEDNLYAGLSKAGLPD